MDGHFRLLQLFHLFAGIRQLPIYQSAPSTLSPSLADWLQEVHLGTGESEAGVDQQHCAHCRVILTFHGSDAT